MQPHEVQLWHIYVCPKCNLSEPPKDKYVVVVHKQKDKIWGFFINSEIHPYIKARPILLNAQVKISAVDHDFLDYDSFIGCDTLKKFYGWELKNHKGALAGPTKEIMLKTIEESETLEPEEIEKILNSA